MDKQQPQDVEMVPAPPNTKLVQALKKMALDRISVEIEMQKKMFQVELEYQDKLKELDNKRRMVIAGDYVPTEEECKFEYANPEEPIVECGDEKGIPKFWPTIFANLDIMNEMVEEDDQELIDMITDIRCILLNEPMGYRLEFDFEENKYFSNKTLTKEYYFSGSYDPTEPLNYDSLYINRCKGCKIQWKSPDLDLTQKKLAKKMIHRKSQQVKTIEKHVQCDSFFNFFDPPEVSMEEADDDTKALLAADFDIAETLRLNVIPRAVIFYTGEGIDEDEYSDLGEFDEESDEDEEDDEEDEEEDDDDVEEDAGDAKQNAKHHGGGAMKHKNKGANVMNGKTAGSGKKAAAGSNNKKMKETPPECKQQ